MTEWLLEHPPLLVGLCIVTLILISEFADRIVLGPINRWLGRQFQIKLPKRIMAAISIVLVALAYVTVVALTAIGFKVLHRRLLPDLRKQKPATYWTKREKTDSTLDYLKRQF
ncbi:hypothetical protein AMJ85_06725 [candidate division BRC1 bacterium SM23_51]|nr:MAG: hypothetical protein AMJ85_06725 [candidate division BRC1 bacterium SM23_51]